MADEMPDPEFVMRVLRLFAMAPHDCTDSLSWRCDGQWAPLAFMVNCSDVFHWATGDADQIDPGDIDALERAFADVQAATGGAAMWWAPILWCARKRGQRPQGAAYPQDGRLWSLFDAAGPPRETGLGNPRRHPGEVSSG